MNSCLITAVRGEDPEEREHVLQEVVEVFSATVKAQILGTVATSNSMQELLVSALHFLSIQSISGIRRIR